MPTYEYECRTCGHRFERFQSMTEEPVSKCPRCAGPVDRLIGAGAGVLFRGSGFHSTDYRSDSYRKAQEKEKRSSESGKGEKAEKGKKGKSDSSPKSDSSKKKPSK